MSVVELKENHITFPETRLNDCTVGEEVELTAIAVAQVLP